MRDTVDYLMENRKKRIRYMLDEQALARGKVTATCMSLGRQFIKHFHKVYEEGLESRDFKHHCKEMHTWYTHVKEIKLKGSNKHLSDEDLEDEFFTAGALVEDFIDDEEECRVYEEFYRMLLSTDRYVSDILEELLSKKG